MAQTTITVTIGDEEHELPYRWEICWRCRGEGKVDAFDGGITSSEWAEWDGDEREDYLDGKYDRDCPECGGTGKAQVPDFTGREDLLKQYEQDQWELAEMHAIEAAERRVGA